MADFFKTTLRLPEDLHQALRMEMAKRRIVSLQEAVEEAVRRWLGAPPAAAPSPPSGLAKEEAHQVGVFVDFLRNGDSCNVELVQHALELHVRKQRSSRKRSSA